MPSVKLFPLFLSEKRDSNPRPQPWQGCALPAELFSLSFLTYMFFNFRVREQYVETKYRLRYYYS